MPLVTQIEIQRRGGACAKYPSSCVIRDLLARAGLLKPFRQLHVLDLTYGRGLFWKTMPQAVIFAFDIRRLDWVRRPKCFVRAAAWAWKHYINNIAECLGNIDLVVADPPWVVKGTSTRRHYGLDRAFGSVWHILNAAAEAARYFNSYLLLHLKDRYKPEGFAIVSQIYFLPMTRYLNLHKPNPYTWWGVLAPE